MSAPIPGGPTPPRRDTPDTETRLRRTGRFAWSVLGILGLIVVVGYLASLLSLLLVPLILALFPATLLVPLAGWMKRRGTPDWAASLVTLLSGLLVLLLVIGAMIPFVVAELPRVAESAGEGLAELEAVIQRIFPEADLLGTDALSLLREWTGEAGDVAGQALSAAMQAFETLAGILLLFVALFFYLKDGHRLFRGITSLVPRTYRPRLEGAAERAWETLGSYFRGQLLVAFVDAALIGLGLFLLGVPIVLPLALLVFFGGLFPIVGAVVTGAVAVLVALADGGLVIGLVAAGIVLAVQQLEGNVLEPMIMSRIVNLHPLVIILVVTAGGLLFGLLGAFLAVPLAAIARQTGEYLLEEAPTGS